MTRGPRPPTLSSVVPEHCSGTTAQRRAPSSQPLRTHPCPMIGTPPTILTHAKQAAILIFDGGLTERVRVRVLPLAWHAAPPTLLGAPETRLYRVGGSGRFRQVGRHARHRPGGAALHGLARGAERVHRLGAVPGNNAAHPGGVPHAPGSWPSQHEHQGRWSVPVPARPLAGLMALRHRPRRPTHQQRRRTHTAALRASASSRPLA